MRCTLIPAQLPEQLEEASKPLQANPDHFRVWDVEKKDWRSFNIDQVKSYVEVNND